MQTLKVDLGERSYPIHIGEGLLDQPELLAPHIAGRQVAIITNETVAPLYLERLTRSLSAYSVISVVLPDGEAFKTWETLQLIFDALLANGCDRKAVLFALGGGVIGDMTASRKSKVQTVTEEESTGNGALATLLRGYRAEAALIPEFYAQFGHPMVEDSRLEDALGGQHPAADGVQVLLDPIAGGRLDDHPRAVRREQAADGARGADRIAHVVQAVEETDEVVGCGGVIFCAVDREGNAVRHAGVFGNPFDVRALVDGELELVSPEPCRPFDPARRAATLCGTFPHLRGPAMPRLSCLLFLLLAAARAAAARAAEVRAALERSAPDALTTETSKNESSEMRTPWRITR